MPEYTHVTHTFEPVYDEKSRVLILGTFPSVLSRAQNFYYGHPQNRFWKVLAQVVDEQPVTTTYKSAKTAALQNPSLPMPSQFVTPVTSEDKKAFLLSHSIAVWDVIESCDIVGSSDTSIRNVIPNDIAGLLQKTKINTICCNGTKSYDLYMRYVYPTTHITPRKLPSTSPANASWSLDRLVQAYHEVLDETLFSH